MVGFHLLMALLSIVACHVGNAMNVVKPYTRFLPSPSSHCIVKVHAYFHRRTGSALFRAPIAVSCGIFNILGAGDGNNSIRYEDSGVTNVLLEAGYCEQVFMSDGTFVDTADGYAVELDT
ncbi:hypothetical protein V8B97DRAFT_445228 [Scleroderma yunnanense]